MAQSIRAMVAADLPKVREIIDANELFPSEMLVEMTSGYLAGTVDAGRWIVLCDGSGDEGAEGASLGVAYYKAEYMTSGTWNVLLLAVHPSSQGQGVGQRLMNHLGAQLEAEGVRLIIVETSSLPAFERTRAFYSEKCGYEQEARIRDFYDAGEDKIVFRKTFGTPNGRGSW